jgi:L-lactate dehydrogenase complex protein LldG
VSAREEILGRVRQALVDVPATDSTEVPRDYRRSLGIDRAAVLDLFAETVSDYRATLHRSAPDQIASAVAAILAGQGITRLAVPADLPDDWLPDDLDVVVDDGRLGAGDLDAVAGAMTAAAVGIAQTGTLVLDAGARQGRRLLSLVPDYHLCVISADDVVGSVPEALGRLDPVRPITLISGPSATSDIELSRVEGVHGPRTLDVLLVE